MCAIIQMKRVRGSLSISTWVFCWAATIAGSASSQIARGQDVLSPDGLWRPATAEETSRTKTDELAAPGAAGEYQPATYRLFTLDAALLKGVLSRAPQETASSRLAAEDNIPTMTLPMPDGSFARFSIVESPVMSPTLAAKFPELRAYRGTGLDDPTMSVRLDWSPSGLRAQVLSAQGTMIVQPTSRENQYRAFSKRGNRGASRPFECLLEGGVDAPREVERAVPPRSGQFLRTYRLAVACTGEYAARFGGTIAQAMAAIHTTVNRVTGIYEREVAVRLVLVDNNDRLLFTDAQADPFSNEEARQLINQSQNVIDERIGDAHYDVGHTLSTGAGGLAGLGVVCRTGQKARGVTGREEPLGDPFDVDYVAHELGHQFGGHHTFNGRSGSCSSSNRNGSTAFEPGSGSTIQAYAGICGADDLQANSDAYFHSISLEQIITYTTVGAGNLPTPVPTGNQIPSVAAVPGSTIPRLTPFKMTASGSDPDGDALLFCWEQRDLGPAADVATPDDGRIPLFRSIGPTPDPWRVFPRWSSLLSSASVHGEQLPTQSRDLHLRVTVRDGRSGVAGDDVVVRVAAEAGPFRVTSPQESTVASHLIDVTWDVAHTNEPPIQTQFVNIVLSGDGGASFDMALASATANDGRELVALPVTAVGSSLRILVEAVNQPFFAITPASFQIAPSNGRIFVVRHAEKALGSDPELTSMGQARARTLARLLSAGRIDHVFSTTAQRTRQTAQPTAELAGTEITPYDDIATLAASLRASGPGKHILVVGHSDSVGPIVNALGIPETISVGDEYDNLFVVNFAPSGVTLEKLKYDVTDALAPQPENLVPASRATLVDQPWSIAPLTPARLVDADPPSLQARGGPIPTDRFAQAARRVAYLDQNWTPSESVEFYGLRQGSPLLRKVFFDALEQPDSLELFRESNYLATFGFLPQRRHAANPDGYPVGFVGTSALELTCAACHTSRLTFGDVEYRIDGSQAMTDIDRWLAELVRALELTLHDAPTPEQLTAAGAGQRIQLDPNTKFGRFAARVLGTPSPRVSQVFVLRKLLEEDYLRRQRYSDYNDYGKSFSSNLERARAPKHEPYGFGRLDALGAILNQACAEALRIDANASSANAPVNYPAIWDAPQHHHVQWNGAVDNTATFGPLGRNTGQVLGVFGLIDVTGDAIVGYDSSVRFDSLERAEELVTKLWSPPWPADFGIDQALAATGGAVYDNECAGCHARMKRDDPRREPRDRLIPLHAPHGRWAPLETDALAAQNWNDRQAKVGPLAGRYIGKPLGDRFADDPNTLVPSRDILSHLAFRAIVRSFVPWREELTLDTAPDRSLVFATRDSGTELLRYKARPLNGVWSTAPYLHNGSVLNMTELLTPPAARKATFRVGSSNYDPANLGFVDDGPFLFDTCKPGNTNCGHAYGTALSSDQKLALLEFLKTL